LPCIVYDSETLKPAKDSPLYELLHDLPNADSTSVEFWEGMTLALLFYGNAFAEKKYIGTKLIALNILHPSCIKIKRSTKDNSREYYYTENGKERKITEKNIFHIKAFGYGGDWGLSPLEYATNTIGNAMASEEAAGRMFANGLSASGILKSDQILKQPQRDQLAENMKAYTSSNNAGKLVILEAGFDYQQLTIKPNDAQMLETRRFSVEQICRIFGVPPVMVGHTDKTTSWGSGVEQIILQFQKTGLKPLLRRIEAAIWRDILTPNERKKYKVKFSMDGLLRGDSKTRSEFLSAMVNNGIYTRNEAREYEDMPRIDGADDLTAQTALAPLDKLGVVATSAAARGSAPQGNN
jgi:HK97 family phage portal protein